MPVDPVDIGQYSEDYDRRIRTFHELMARKIVDILLISSLYDYCILEEDGRLAERIIHEYRGLNLSKPPRINWVSSAEEALQALERKTFQLVIIIPRLAERDPSLLVQEIKKRRPDLPIILLTHRNLPPQVPRACVAGEAVTPGIDRIFVWSGNTDLLLALIKSVEDWWNVDQDTEAAGVRVILFIEDSPFYLSSLLPILYREVVSQTQAAIGEGLNEEHRLLTMRSRAKILAVQTFEEALRVCERYKPFLLGVISDVSFPRNCRLDNSAGPDLLRLIQREIPDLPLLLTSSDPQNKEKANRIPAFFLDKNSPSLHAEIRSFFLDHLGFGDFVFRMPDGREVARASNRRALEQALKQIPLESFVYHANRNDFSRWLFARSEIFLAQRFRPLTGADFDGDMEKRRRNLCSSLELQRKWRQKGVVVDFDPREFDPDTELLKIGRGSLGGKARGLGFVSNLFKRRPSIAAQFPTVDIVVPQSLVVTTEGFDAVVAQGGLKSFSKVEADNEEIAAHFLAAPFPEQVRRDLRAFLAKVHYPLAVRSSSLLEDAQFQAYAGLYQTYMLPNDHPDPEERLRQLVLAIRLVYASTYFDAPKAFARRVGQRTEEEKMAVIVQKLIGNSYQGFFYPTISGVAQSHNYFPFGRMLAEDGCATIALGLGKTVVEGGSALRFSPRYPQILPQFSKVEDILRNSQRLFYAVRMGGGLPPNAGQNDPNLVRREVIEAEGEPPLLTAASTYIADEGRIRDTAFGSGNKVITFAQVLKYKAFPLCEILTDLLALTEDGMGAPVEIEFSVDCLAPKDKKPVFAILQARPMTAREQFMEVVISDEEISRAFCYSTQALGNSQREDLVDILYIKPRAFDPARTPEIAMEIDAFNNRLAAQNRPYLLIGPGRWGSSDRWLGIPVSWSNISGVAAIVEASAVELKAEPSQGSHFFHNVTTLGINYFTVSGLADFIRWDRLESLPVKEEKEFVAHVVLNRPFMLKVDGRKSLGVIYSIGP